MNTQTQEALKMAIETLENVNSLLPCVGVIMDANWIGNEAIQACKEALAQPEDYLYVYKGSEIWLKDSLDIPSAGFLIGKIRLEK